MNQWYPWSFSSQKSEEEGDEANTNIQNAGAAGVGIPTPASSFSDQSMSSVSVSNSQSGVAGSSDFDQVDALLAEDVASASVVDAVMRDEMNSQEERDQSTSVNPRLVLLRHALEEVRDTLNKAIDILGEEVKAPGAASVEDMRDLERALHPALTMGAMGQIMPAEGADGSGRVVEGVFDGQTMVGADGKQYSVPANYASKSKLVEGDVMKLTIAPQGTFVYKQIGPVERKRIIARLEQNSDTHDFHAVLGDARWRILTASVTYFKGMAGDEVVILVSQTTPCKWAAVENIIKKI